METSFEILVDRFLRLIEKDRGFFEYFNVGYQEAYNIAVEQATGYIMDAVDILYDNCSPDVDFYDYDDEVQVFNFEMTKKEIGLIVRLMRQVYFERDLAKLRAFQIAMTPSDLNQFSPASERKTFVDMVNGIKQENINDISRYAATDRLTGKRKMIDHSKYSY